MDNSITTSPHLCPEYRVLLACARTTLSPEQAAELRRLVSRPLDWAFLLQAGRQHFILPLLYRHLNTAYPEQVPAEVLADLQHVLHAIAPRNLMLTGWLLRLVTLLEDHAIPVLPYKGPALAMQIYGDLSLRLYGDLDLLIRQRDFPRARTLLVQEGLAPVEPLQNDREAVAYAKWLHEYHLGLPDQDVQLELQWKVIPLPAAFPPDDLDWWRQLPTLHLGGRQLPALPPETLLLILCAHGAKHLWARLSWLCDVAELIRSQPTLDLARTNAQARRLGMERMFLFSLALARDLLDVALPDELTDRIRTDRVVARYVRLSREMFLLGGRREGDLPAEMLPRLPILHLAMLDRLPDRLRACRLHYRRAFNPLLVLQTYGASSFRYLREVLTG